MNEELINALYIIAGLYILYKIFRHYYRPDKTFQKEVYKIINSDEYKVKGKYE